MHEIRCPEFYFALISKAVCNFTLFRYHAGYLIIYIVVSHRREFGTAATGVVIIGTRLADSSAFVHTMNIKLLAMMHTEATLCIMQLFQPPGDPTAVSSAAAPVPVIG